MGMMIIGIKWLDGRSKLYYVIAIIGVCIALISTGCCSSPSSVPWVEEGRLDTEIAHNSQNELGNDDLVDDDFASHITESSKLERTDMVGILNLPLVVENVREAVVSVVVEKTTVGIWGEEQGSNSGSGVFFRDDGYILTNNHVIEGATKVLVTVDDGDPLEAEIVGVDYDTDLAVLKIDELNDQVTHLDFADPDTIKVGQWVIAIGNALALPGGPSVTLGIVSALDRSLKMSQNHTLYDLIQTDTIINPGNSGGPLLNMSGEIVGINTAGLRGERVEGIGFAVSGETAFLVAKEIIEFGEVRWPWLGIGIQEMDAQQIADMSLVLKRGVLVVNVTRNSPAYGAGIMSKDVILALDGKQVLAIKDLTRVLRSKFGSTETIAIKIWRDGNVMELDVTLGKRPGD